MFGLPSRLRTTRRALATLSTLLLMTTPALAQEYVPGEVIVKLKGKSKTLQAQAFIGKAVAEKSMSLKGSWSGLNMHHFALKAGESVENAIADLKADPDVLYAEPNYIFKMQSAGLESQPIAMDEVRSLAVSDISAFAQTNANIQLQQGWSAMSSTSTVPVVAVIDTGLDLSHSVFTQSNAIWQNPRETVNGIDDDGNGYVDDVSGWNFVANNNSPQDDDGHGTHVAGIVLGATQDITAVPIAQAKIKIMPLKFLDANGSGTTSDAVKAIYYAVNNGADVLNNSWGGGGFSNSLLDAIAYAYDKQSVFVAAAGNASSNNDAAPTYPANYTVPNVISIAATSDADGFASFSNYGKQTVHMGSPGVSIWSTFPGNMYGRSSGTSMAAPFVAGVAALMLREKPEMNGYQVKSLIFDGAVQVTSLQTRTTTKARLNALNAVNAAKVASVDASQPGFDAAALRSPASETVEQVPACGLVGKAVYDATRGSGPGAGPQKNLAFFAILLLLAAPIAASFMLRKKDDGASRRRHTRYQIDTGVVLKFGERELRGQVSSISMGGVQLNTDAWLEQGGVVTMSIRSPDGKDEIKVEGRVVWSEEKKRYGVAFENADDSIKSTVARWTQGLLSN